MLDCFLLKGIWCLFSIIIVSKQAVNECPAQGQYLAEAGIEPMTLS